jgi:ketosteroid isomerase-like protein
MKRFASGWLSSCVLVLGALSAQAQSADESALRALDQKLLDAIADGGLQLYSQTLAPEAMSVDENGAIQDCVEFLKQLQPMAAGVSGSLKMVTHKAQIFGDFATVIHTDDEVENYHGQTLHAQYLTTETWTKRAGHWQLLLLHVAALAHTPTAVRLSPRELEAYPGRYTAGTDLVYVVTLKEGHLEGGRPGRTASRLDAEVRDVFFIEGQPRVRKIFERDASGKVSGFVDRREGGDLVWKKG